MDSFERRLSDSIDRAFPSFVDLLADLVRMPSVLGREGEAQILLYRHARAMGLDAQIWDVAAEELAGERKFVQTGRSYRGRPNLSAVLPGSGGGHSLVFNGHIDVVSPEPIDRWTRGPWNAERDGARLYGRGAYDMKGGLVAGLLALHALGEVGGQLRGHIYFESVIEEECTGNGTFATRLRSGRVDGAVILEPTDLCAWTATAGVIWFEIAVAGRAAYVGLESDYVNAIDRAAGLIVGLRSLVDDLNRVEHPLFREFRRPFTLSVGTIRGGDWPSNVPVDCVFVCRMAFPPDWSVERAQRLVEERIQQLASSDPWLAEHPPRLTYPGFRAEGWIADPEQPLLTLLDDCHRVVTRTSLAHRTFTGTADARYFDAANGEQAIFYGPAGGAQHAPDEWVDLDSIATAAKTLCLLAASWCR